MFLFQLIIKYQNDDDTRRYRNNHDNNHIPLNSTGTFGVSNRLVVASVAIVTLGAAVGKIFIIIIMNIVVIGCCIREVDG